MRENEYKNIIIGMPHHGSTSEEFLDAGADYILQNPFTKNELYEIIDKLLLLDAFQQESF